MQVSIRWTKTYRVFSGAEYLSDNDEFSMIFFGAIRSPKVTIKWVNHNYKFRQNY